MADAISTERLQAIRDNALARLEEITETPKPSYNIDGQQVQWQQYAQMLQGQIDWAEERLNKAADGPFEEVSQAVT